MKYIGTQLEESIKQVEALQTAAIDIVRDLEREIYSDADLIEYYHTMYALLEKQQNLYNRLVLIDDPNLYGILLAINEMCVKFGLKKDEDINNYHVRAKNEMKKSICALTGENLDDYDEIVIDFNWE